VNNTERKEGSIDAIKTAIASLNQQGKKVTQQSVAELTKGTVSISTIRRHWNRISPTPEKISPVIAEKESPSFASFRRRAKHSIMGVYKCSPDMF